MSSSHKKTIQASIEFTMLQLPCTVCRKPPGEWCVDSDGNRTTKMHYHRGDALWSMLKKGWQSGYKKGSCPTVGISSTVI